MEPWHSVTAASGKPARWNCPSTLEVKMRVGHRSAQRRSTAKPACGVVQR